jgi:glycosyltransferase involved in cell wall biosynthesis
MKGGAERMNIEIAKILSADIATTVWKSDCYDARAMGFEGKIIEILPNFRKGILGFLQMKWAFFHRWDIYDGYDVVIFSNEAITGIWNITKWVRTIYYAHSISRHLFDQRGEYMQKIQPILRPLVVIGFFFLKILYKKEVVKADLVLTNSPLNIDRIHDWLDVESELLSPPVDTNSFYPEHHEHSQQHFDIPIPYFLSFARLTHAKRIDTIIRAFQKVPEKNLLILFGSHDSQREEFMQLAWIQYPIDKRDTVLSSPIYPNISFLSLSDNRKLPNIIRWSIASIAISKEEDFGMVAIESMACGIPVIAVDEWGYKETIIHRKTGILIDPQDLEENLIHTIRVFHSDEFQTEDCRLQAEQFSLTNFHNQLLKYVNAR